MKGLCNTKLALVVLVHSLRSRKARLVARGGASGSWGRARLEAVRVAVKDRTREWLRAAVRLLLVLLVLLWLMPLLVVLLGVAGIRVAKTANERRSRCGRCCLVRSRNGHAVAVAIATAESRSSILEASPGTASLVG